MTIENELTPDNNPIHYCAGCQYCLSELWQDYDDVTQYERRAEDNVTEDSY